MKTWMIILALLEIFFLASAKENKFSYVITNNDTLYCQNMVAGPLNLNCVLNSGEKVKISYNSIQTYFDGQKTKVKLPVYLNGMNTGKMAFMELVGCENGILIYKYVKSDTFNDCEDAVFSFYDKSGYLYSQTNPDLAQIENFIKNRSLHNKSVSDTHLLSNQ
jgi:hypothetical protein